MGALSRTAYEASLTEQLRTHLRRTLGAAAPAEWGGHGAKRIIELAIDVALAYDAEATLREAVRLRQCHVYVTPQVMLVRAAHHAAVRGPMTTPKGARSEPSLIDRYAARIICSADEPAIGMAYQLTEYGRTVPNSLKRAWARALERRGAHELPGSQSDGIGVRIADVISLSHPKGPEIGRLMAPVPAAAESDARSAGHAWQSLLDAAADGDTREGWLKALPLMPYEALLHNVRNLVEKQVPTDLWLGRLVAGAADGKESPYRYYAAHKAIEQFATSDVLDALERCVDLAMVALPTLEGRVISLCDNSGSGWGIAQSAMAPPHIAQIANLTGAIAGKQANEGYLGVFGDGLEILPVAAQDSALATASRADEIGRRIGAGSETGIWLFWERAIREQQHWDTVFVLSDMQAGHGGLAGAEPSQYADYAWGDEPRYIDVPKLIAAYRRKVNPNVMVYLVRMAGYADTIVPEFYDRTFMLGGWSEGLFRFATRMTDLWRRDGGTA